MVKVPGAVPEMTAHSPVVMPCGDPKVKMLVELLTLLALKPSGVGVMAPPQ